MDSKHIFWGAIVITASLIIGYTLRSPRYQILHEGFKSIVVLDTRTGITDVLVQFGLQFTWDPHKETLERTKFEDAPEK